jgi:N-acetylglucosaminyl-diphospho-decaprenol L-rhamnosyltransferase
VDLSICVLTNRQPELLARCVAACLAEIERGQVEGEIIVVDNGSCDHYPEKLVRAQPQVKVIRSEQNVGFSAGNNMAIRQSRGKTILILNDDAILQPYSLKLMLQKLESRPRLAAVGPKLVNPDGSPQRGFTNKRAITLRSILSRILSVQQISDKWWLTRRLLTQLKDDSKSADADELAAACLLLRRQALDDVGLFDENFYYWSEDIDLCWRMRKAGWKLSYVAEAQVTHYGSASLNRLEIFERRTMFYGSLVYFMKKHWHPVRYRISRTILVLAFFVRVPAGLTFRLLRPGKGLQEAMNSARLSLQTACWLISKCK